MQRAYLTLHLRKRKLFSQSKNTPKSTGKFKTVRGNPNPQVSLFLPNIHLCYDSMNTTRRAISCFLLISSSFRLVGYFVKEEMTEIQGFLPLLVHNVWNNCSF